MYFTQIIWLQKLFYDTCDLNVFFFRPKTKPDLPKLDIDKAKQNQEQESKVSLEVTVFLVWLD